MSQQRSLFAVTESWRNSTQYNTEGMCFMFFTYIIYLTNITIGRRFFRESLWVGDQKVRGKNSYYVWKMSDDCLLPSSIPYSEHFNLTEGKTRMLPRESVRNWTWKSLKSGVPYGIKYSSLFSVPSRFLCTYLKLSLVGRRVCVSQLRDYFAVEVRCYWSTLLIHSVGRFTICICVGL